MNFSKSFFIYPFGEIGVWQTISQGLREIKNEPFIILYVSGRLTGRIGICFFKAIAKAPSLNGAIIGTFSALIPPSGKIPILNPWLTKL